MPSPLVRLTCMSTTTQLEHWRGEAERLRAEAEELRAHVDRMRPMADRLALYAIMAAEADAAGNAGGASWHRERLAAAAREWETYREETSK